MPEKESGLHQLQPGDGLGLRPACPREKAGRPDAEEKAPKEMEPCINWEDEGPADDAGLRDAGNGFRQKSVPAGMRGWLREASGIYRAAV